MPTETLTLSTPDGPMPAYLAWPGETRGGTTRGGVIVIQEAFGVSPHIEDVTRRVAAAGFVGIAPALYHREGSPVFPHDDFQALMPTMNALRGQGLLADIDAAVAALTDRGVTSIGIIGFCMGGTVSLYAATQREFAASVSFYGGGVTEGRWDIPPLAELAPQLRGPWLGLYGDQDAGIPVDQVEQLREAAAGSGQPTELVRYAAAGHAFHNDQRTGVYVESAAKDAWRRTIDFLTTHLGTAAA